MNKEWSGANKLLQAQLKKQEAFTAGLRTLFALRDDLMSVLGSFKADLPRAAFDAMPFVNADGYHSKTIAYSIWHIFRIEDIVASTLIDGTEQVLFAGDYAHRIHSPIITTGNELVKEKIADFSRQLDLDALYSYAWEVKARTEKILTVLSFDDLKKKIPAERKERLQSLCVVSGDEKASWLIDYWCGKDIRGLIQMPFSRHWIMHVEASQRIRNKLIV